MGRIARIRAVACASLAAVVLAAPAARAQEDGTASSTRTADSFDLRIARLNAALDADARLDISLEALFGVDIADEDAVAARLAQLESRIAGLEQKIALTGTTAPDRALIAATRKARRALILERKFLSQDPAVRTTRALADRARQQLAQAARAAEARSDAADEKARAAELVQQRALVEAEQASSALVRTLKSQRAAVARADADLAETEQQLSAARGMRVHERTHLLEREHALALAAQRVAASTVAADLYPAARDGVRRAATELRAALALLATPVPQPKLTIAPVSPAASASEPAVAAAAELAAAVTAFSAHAASVEATEQSARVEEVRSAHQRVADLSRTKSELLAILTGADRRAVVGLSRAAFEEIRLELSVLAARAEGHVVITLDAFENYRGRVANQAWLRAALILLGKLLLIIGLALWLWRQLPGAFEAIRRYEFRNIKSIVRLRRIDRVVRAVWALVPTLLYLGAVFAIGWVLGDRAEIAELSVALRLATWTGYYLLIKTITDRFIFRLLRRRHRLDAEMRTHVERTTVIIGRTLLTGGVVLSLAVPLVGRGVVYAWLVRLVALGFVLVTLLLIRSWRPVIIETYLATWPEGRLARLVESSRDRFYGPLLVVLAFGYVVVDTLARLGRDSVLGFEQSRKALAFVFRKRLERKAEKLGSWNGDVDELPDALLAAFSLEPVVDAGVRVDHFPGLDLLESNLSSWHAGQKKGSFLVEGERGYGKSSWLHRARELVDETETPVTWIDISRGDADGPAAFAMHIASATGIDGADDLEALAAGLNTGPQRVLILDDLQHLFVRAPGGLDALDALMGLIEHTGEKVFWLCTIERRAWRFIKAARPNRAWFRCLVGLDPWSESDIAGLLMARAASSGVIHRFEDLALDDSQRTQAALAEAGEGYTRLIWDTADGCPLSALHYWLRSLVPVNEGVVRVRLFSTPSLERLEALPSQAALLYAALSTHARLSIREAAEVLRLAEPVCECFLVQGVEEGYLATDGERFGFSTHWYRPIIRYLTRQHWI